MFNFNIWDVIHKLAARGKLRNLVIIASFDFNSHGVRNPRYCKLSNFRKLVFHGMIRFNKEIYLQSFVDMLLASPHLRVLGLSGDGIEYEDDDGDRVLEVMCDMYAAKRTESGIPLLQLEELELGNGFQLNESSFALRPSYLGRMTGLECLRRVGLDNEAKWIDFEARPGLGYIREREFL
jgi:hypothetical protein